MSLIFSDLYDFIIPHLLHIQSYYTHDKNVIRVRALKSSNGAFRVSKITVRLYSWIQLFYRILKQSLENFGNSSGMQYNTKKLFFEFVYNLPNVSIKIYIHGWQSIWYNEILLHDLPNIIIYIVKYNCRQDNIFYSHNIK